jgi:hypothetical protein
MLESEIEAYFVKRVREAGGLCYKFVSPGRRGVPDRLVVCRSSTYFVELKAPGRPLRPEQEREHERLADAGASVHKIDSYKLVDFFVEMYL